MTASLGQASPFDFRKGLEMNFLLDLLFGTFQGILTTVISAIFQVPLDVITSFLTGLVTPSA